MLKLKMIDIWSLSIFFIMMDFPFVNSRDRFIIKVILIMIMFLFAIIKYKNKYILRDCWPIFPYAISIIYSGYYNYGMSDMFMRSCCYALIIIALYMFTGIMGRRFGFKNMIEALYKTLQLIIIIADATVILTNGRGVDSSLYLGNFIIGNKFVVSYFNMLFLALYCMHNKKKKKCQFLVIAIIIIFVCIKAGTATGAVGIAIITLLYLFSRNLRDLMCAPFTFLVALALSSVLVIAFQQIVFNHYVAAFIINVLHRSIDMTGRMQIYNVLVSIFNENIWVGHGYNNTSVFNIVGYGNPQNGIFDILINYGIIGLILFICVCFISLSSIEKDKCKVIFPIVCYLYGMIVCATVEICLATSFILGLSILRVYGICQKYSNNI